MELRDRIFGPIHLASEKESPGRRVDFGDFIRKLILSEQVILEAGLLEDFPPLIAKFGYDGMTELLKSGRLRILADFFTTTNTGQTEILDWRREKGILPLGSYSLSVVALHDLREHVSKGMSAINDVPGLPEKQSKRLRKLIAERLLSLPADRGTRAIEQANQDIATNPLLVKRAISVGARNHFQLEITPDAFDFSAEFLDDTDFRTETNLRDVLGLDAETTHKIVERGLLGVTGLGQRLEYMERFQAVTGFKVDELDLFEEKLGFLARQLDPDAARERFDRVVELLDLPDVDSDPGVRDVDLARLTEVLASDEAKQFRQWLRGIDQLDDKEVADEIKRIREKLAHAVTSNAGKAVRFTATTGLGVVLPPAGVALGALDTFVTDKVLREDGPTAFLGRLYPSIFQ